MSMIDAAKKIAKPKRVSRKKIAASVASVGIAMVVGIHAAFGCRPHHISHEISVYADRIAADCRTLDLKDYQGNDHQVDLYGCDDRRYDQALVQIYQTLPDKVVRNTHSIRFEPEGSLEHRCGDAHLIYNRGVICLENGVAEDTIVHELYHQAFYSLSLEDQYEFSRIGSQYFRESIIPIASYEDHWESDNLPEGKEGPAYGMVSHYASKNAIECAAETASSLWRFAYPGIGKGDENPYKLIFQNPKDHFLQDHRKRYDFFVDNGLLTKRMINVLEPAFTKAESQSTH